MGKKNKNLKIFPFVSLCTPTFNRRPFIPYMIKCFEHQTYPKDRIEWIIVDDGTDPIGDLVKDIPQVKYFYYENKMILGKKRNLMHSKCSGDIIIYMDDDDYYPPERISHAVEKLTNSPFLMAGSSEMNIYFASKNSVFQCGPYAQYHATAATFAFKKELLKQTSYDDDKAFAEESKFTKNYTIPLIQLDTLKTILVFSHKHNSLNKEKLLENPLQTRCFPSKHNVDDFVKDPVLKQFYMYDVNKVLEDYDPGKIENKPELLIQLKNMEIERERQTAENRKLIATQQKMLSNSSNKDKDIETIRKEYEKQIENKNILINELLKKVKELTNELTSYKTKS